MAGIRGNAWRMVLAAWMTACVAGFAVASRHWPLVGDATYLHYAVMLMRHGMRPYAEIADMNLPGAYLLEWGAMAALGGGSAGWRVYDLLLLAMACGATMYLLRVKGWLAGLFAASLFALVHGQDGVIMSGERDLAVAALLAAAVAALVRGVRQERGRGWWLVGSGAMASWAVSVKPTAGLFPVVMLVWVMAVLRRRGARWAGAIGAFLAGVLVPVLGEGWFLLRWEAMAAYAEALWGIVRYHATIDQRSLGYLLAHSVAPVEVLLGLGVGCAVMLRRGWGGEERVLLLLGAASGWVSYLLQGKGFPYQRYPFLVFLLMVVAGDLIDALEERRRAVRWVGVAGLMTGAVLGGVFLLRLMRFDRREPARPLVAELNALGGKELRVQCMDTAGGCIDAMYAARRVQATGFLYDCYLLDGRSEVVRGLRERFWRAIEQTPPEVFVVTDSVCYSQPRSFAKYAGWPEFERFLEERYVLREEHHPTEMQRYWSRASLPFAYRIYVRR